MLICFTVTLLFVSDLLDFHSVLPERTNKISKRNSTHKLYTIIRGWQQSRNACKHQQWAWRGGPSSAFTVWQQITFQWNYASTVYLEWFAPFACCDGCVCSGGKSLFGGRVGGRSKVSTGRHCGDLAVWIGWVCFFSRTTSKYNTKGVILADPRRATKETTYWRLNPFSS